MKSATNPDLPVEIDIATSIPLKGFLHAPQQARGLVLFVHGSGSSRFGACNNHVARFLATHGFAALLMDLLTTCEEQNDAITRELRFDIPMLAERVVATIDWLAGHPALARLPIGLFGAGTGAAAQRPERVQAVVCRCGRPDLACESLKLVRTPTLMIVDSEDAQLLEFNRYAASCMLAPLQLVIVAGADRPFEEPALTEVTQHAVDWLKKYLPAKPAALSP